MKKYLFLFVTALTAVGTTRADVGAVLPVGDLQRWGEFSLGLNGDVSRIWDDAIVNGDVAVGPNGVLALANRSTINGDVYFARPGSLRTGPATTITGSRFSGQTSYLNQEVTAAFDFSKAAGALAPTRNLSLIDLNNSNMTLSGAPGETVVLNLRLIRMRGDSTLTLQGAPDTTYVINVNRGFSLTDAAKIVLTGGLDWNDVVFNVRGRGDAITIGGNTSFQGILLATRRTVQLRNSAIIRGEVIADTLLMHGTAQITHPAVVSP